MTTIILLILNLILLVSLFVAGIWYSRHHHQQITDQIERAHGTVRHAFYMVKQVDEDVRKLKGDLKP